ncbi:hypothetical protein ACU8M5_10495 [Rhizobium leguminosarum]
MIRPESLSTVRLETYFHDVLLGYGTAFLYRYGQFLGLITNWHNIAGRNPQNGAFLDSRKFVPNRIKFNINIREKSGKIVVPRDVELELVKDGQPIWVETALLPVNGGELADLAGIILNDHIPDFDDIGERIVSMPANMLARREEDGEFVSGWPTPMVGSDVFILGFPKGLATQGVLPVWKRGSIASEPLRAVANRPVFLIDTVSRKGMSGSPIISFGRDITDDDGIPLSNEAPDDTMWLVGVFAGSSGSSDDELSMALGRGWGRRHIDSLFWRPETGGSQIELLGSLSEDPHVLEPT